MLPFAIISHKGQEVTEEKSMVEVQNKLKEQKLCGSMQQKWEFLDKETYLSLRETKWMDTVEKPWRTDTMNINRCWKLCGVATVLVKTGWRNWYITLSKLE